MCGLEWFISILPLPETRESSLEMQRYSPFCYHNMEHKWKQRGFSIILICGSLLQYVHGSPPCWSLTSPNAEVSYIMCIVYNVTLALMKLLPFGAISFNTQCFRHFDKLSHRFSSKHGSPAAQKTVMELKYKLLSSYMKRLMQFNKYGSVLLEPV